MYLPDWEDMKAEWADRRDWYRYKASAGDWNGQEFEDWRFINVWDYHASNLWSHRRSKASIHARKIEDAYVLWHSQERNRFRIQEILGTYWKDGGQ